MMLNFIIYIFLVSTYLFSQSAIGDWEAYLNYSSVNTISTVDNIIYAGTETQFFSYNESDNSISSFSKLNGFSDNNISAIKYDPISKILVLGYQNGNVDLFFQNQVTNIPHIKNANIIGDKTINHIFIKDQLAYLSCSFGLVKLDIINAEILDTYYFMHNGINSEVFGCYVFDNEINYPNDHFLAGKIFVTTNAGLLFAESNNPNLINPENWNSELPVFNNNVLLGNINTVFNTGISQIIGSSSSQKSLFLNPENSCAFLSFSSEKNGFIMNEIPQICSDSENIISIASSSESLLGFSRNTLFVIKDISSLGDVFSYWISSWNPHNSFKDICFSKDVNIKIYFADKSRGIMKCEINSINNQFSGAPIEISPNGPIHSGFGDMKFLNNKLIISHGGKNSSWNNLYNTQEISIYENHTFSHTESLKSLGVYDAIPIATQSNNNSFFVGTWNSGLLEFEGNNLITVYNHENSLSDVTGSHALESISQTDSWVRIGGACFDNQNILWVTNSQSESAPVCSFNGEFWSGYGVSNIPSSIMSGKILCAQNGQKWIQLRGNNGLVVSEKSKNNLNSKTLTSSVSNGNLPSNTINCFTEDLENNIWVGSSNGVGVFYNSSNIFSNTNFDCEIPLVEVDGYVERLLFNTNVLDVDVDGGNRKWFATAGQGAFLISDNGTSQIYHFTAENSGLLSNTVYGVRVDPKSGTVFFATDVGLCSFRSNATSSEETFQNVLIFPNPVRRHYDGLISISGLTDQTNIKITDVSGNLVFETYSEGGMASWDGRSFSGEKVQTGVYLFFCTNQSFDESIVKKVLIYN